mgnify:CR=1 FL=1
MRCPCVAARIESPGFVLVYSGDIIAFERPEAALAGADLYIEGRFDAQGARSCAGTRQEP